MRKNFDGPPRAPEGEPVLEIKIRTKDQTPLYLFTLPGVGEIKLSKPTYIPDQISGEDIFGKDGSEDNNTAVALPLSEIRKMIDGATCAMAKLPEAFEKWLKDNNINYRRGEEGMPPGYFDLLG